MLHDTLLTLSCPLPTDRSKLLMTEIPQELEEQLNMSEMLKAFMLQLELLIRMRDQLHDLFIAGHFAYQAGYEREFGFDMEHGIAVLEKELERLSSASKNWKKTVQASRREYYFLNFYTMREIWRLKQLLVVCADPASKRTASVSSKSSGDAASKPEAKV